MRTRLRARWLGVAVALVWGLPIAPTSVAGDLVVRGDVVHTVSGEPLEPGVVLIRGARIVAVGRPEAVAVPAGTPELRARVVTPGLIDAHSVVGVSGMLNQSHDQEQLEKSAPIQPELRAVDAFNADDELVAYVRSLGVTTLHTGHAPGALISGQTMVVKTHPSRLDESVLVPMAMIATTLGDGSLSGKPDKAPGTRAKAVALLRAELVKAGEYARKRETGEVDKRPAWDLRLEALAKVLDRSVPLLVTVHRHQDVLAALRLAEEFRLRLVLDGVSDAPMVLDDVRKSGFPVLLHPSMWRPFQEARNLSLETASKLQAAGIPFALQSGFESYVPKTRIVLFEAAVAAANGLSFGDALASVTLGAARILGVSDRVGSLEPGKDADLALYDGDPFEYTTHCVGVVVNGVVTDSVPR
ncbi:MAG: amidohydrolase family protein [Limisphaerales bacterium]